jgi:pyruvate/2-oxoglutarate/acetoin dehydrogenase E1 component
MDQLCNQAAKQHYMSGGKLTVPMVLRTNLGATRRSAAQHSQSLQALVAHIPGAEGRPAVISLRGEGPDEDRDPRQQSGRDLRRQADVPGQGPVPEEEYLIPFGEANVKREGSRHHADRHVVDGAGGREGGRNACRGRHRRRGDRSPHHRAAGREDADLDSVKKTSRAIVIDEGHQSYGVTAEIAARLNEKAFYHLDAPVLRMGAMDVPVPFSPALEDLTVPTPEAVVENARKLCAGELIHAA